MSTIYRWLVLPLLVLAGLVVAAVAVGGLLVVLAYPKLPSLEALTDYRPKIPLRIYTSDGHLIGEFGEERRAVVQIQHVPESLKQAIVAAEDERFYQHSGVDTLGVLRAAYSNLVAGGKRQGASTITMQLARNFFLTSEKAYTRKFFEVLLAFKIEANLSKDEILQLYMNQIYLGQRAYGFAAAAQTYFGKPVQALTLGEAAMLAGLPKAPSAYNPVANKERAKQRQHYVLRRMYELGFISTEQRDKAEKEPMKVRNEAVEYAVKAPYVAETARQIAYEQFKEETYTRGINVVTTITKADQEQAYDALRKGVLEYDRRHGYRGAEGFVDIGKGGPETPEVLDAIEKALGDTPDSDDLISAVVLDANPNQVRAYLSNGETVTVGSNSLRFARGMLDDKAPPNKRIRRGSIIRLKLTGKTWDITQMPEVEAALVAASSSDGAVRALVGGFDFARNKFNHVTQAWRQPGSSFKPFIYSAALERGFTPTTVVLDEPLVVPAAQTGSQTWEPKNYDDKYEGPMPMRTGLAKSKNMVSIRILQSIGTKYAQEFVTRFGFDADRNPPYLTMALGAGSVTPWQMLTGYSVFANGGYRVQPFLVKEIYDDRGNVLAKVSPRTAGDESMRVLDARNAYLMDGMMQEVTRSGTGARARQVIRRNDLAGKTGTTNDVLDAWFCGYQPGLVAVAWIGFDQPRKLGDKETGAQAALPIWLNYMGRALKGVPEARLPIPEGLITIARPGEGDGSEEGMHSDDPSRPGAPTADAGTSRKPKPAAAPPSQEFIYRELAPAPVSEQPPAPRSLW